jgi:hypothetical protein
MGKKVMKLVDSNTGKMECKICGSIHFASMRPNAEGGGYRRGSWQCDNSCKFLDDGKVWNGRLQKEEKP